MGHNSPTKATGLQAGEVLFTELGNQIAIAARGGTDPALNSSLAMAIEKAVAANKKLIVVNTSG